MRPTRELPVIDARHTVRSDRHDAEDWIERLKIIWIGCDRWLTGAVGADHHMGIDNVGCSTGRQQASDVCGINSIERYDVGGLAKEASQTCLSFWRRLA